MGTMWRLTLTFAAASVFCFGADTLYSISDSCYPAQCTATVLNDRGEIAGQYFNRVSAAVPSSADTTDARGFLAAHNGFIAPLISDSNSYVLPRGINNAGALAVEYGAYGSASLAGVYSPLSNDLLNLSAVLGWAGPSRALSINDFGDVAAMNGTSFVEIQPGFRCPCFGFPFAVTNSRQVVYASKSNGRNPTSTWSVMNSSFEAVLRGQVISVSAGGHVLEREDYIIPYYFIYVPGGIERLLSLEDTTPFAINDADQLLVHTQGGDALWDGAGRPRLLTELIGPNSTWKILRGRAINNAGQILVDADNGLRATSLVLSPPASRTPPRATTAAAATQVQSVNGRRPGR